jgi:hypothetical protein
MTTSSSSAATIGRAEPLSVRVKKSFMFLYSAAPGPRIRERAAAAESTA